MTCTACPDDAAHRRRGGTAPGVWPARRPLRMVCVAALCGPAAANIFLHSPRGSNNKLNEVSNAVRNTARLFDSRNHRNGGYQVGDNCDPTCSDANGMYDSSMPGAGQGQMYFYEGSILDVEWTAQHGCGSANANVHCTMVLQYMCEDSAPGLRDGTSTDRIPDTTAGAADSQYGMHEPLQWYQDCQARMRNKGLYSADQQLTGGGRASALLQPTPAQTTALDRGLTPCSALLPGRRQLRCPHAAEPSRCPQRIRVPRRA